MDMVYFEHPLFILFPIFLLLWQIFVFLLKKRINISSIVYTLLTSVSVICHAIAISVILIKDGTLADALLLVLLSGTLTLLLSPKQNETANIKEEEE